MLILGNKEEKAKKAAVRLRTEEDLGQLDIESFIKRVRKVIDTKSLEL
jgi:threonyl-tRNA synthetase